jgi:ribosomal protein S18 acetylase RimI-like enzyme
MDVEIRPMRDGDLDRIVELSLRAWEPVFVSIEATMGERLFGHFYGDDWRISQEADVRRACTGLLVLVAVQDGRVVGFTAVDRKEGDDGDEGEIHMLAVDPSAQGAGVGGLLTEAGVDVIRAAGKRVAMVATGGDPGHAAARATYERAGFTAWPSVQYYRLLLDGR